MSKSKKYLTCDGNHAAAHVAYMFSEVAAIYPITPSSNMAENVDEWAAGGRKNLFNETVSVSEMQSEGGASGAVHGSLQAGALTTTFTASQGLLLMIPNMYKIAGELLPCVFHVSARSLAAQALSIFGDHSDVMSARNTGFAFLASGSVQQVMDLGGIAHLAAIKGRVPFVHFFDGFRTSHEIQKIETLENEDLEDLLDKEALKAFRDGALNPEHPVTRGTAQNPDIYFQSREASNKFYDAIPDIVNDYMQEISKITGRDYKPFTYYGAADAENVVIAMGSITETIQEVVDHLVSKGEKIGLLTVHLYRPFSAKYFMNAMPKSVKKISVLDRTKEPGANGEPLYLDVRDLYYGKENAPVIVGGRYGLSSKDTTPAMMVSVFDNLKQSNPKNQFTVGIVDDVTNLSLPLLPEISVSAEGTFEGKFYGLGGDGTVGANKSSIKIIGNTTDKYAQAYFAYDSKKSGGITTSHLRFGDSPIRSPYLVVTPDFVSCQVPAYLEKYDMAKGIKQGGTFLLNSIWDVEETKNRLPNRLKKQLADNKANLYIINATKIAEEIGLGGRINTIMQSAFFKVSDIISFDQAVIEMKTMIKKAYGKKGQKVVDMNNEAVDQGGDSVVKIEVPQEWATLKEEQVVVDGSLPAFVKDVMNPINNLKGDDLPVSAFNGREDGTFPAGTTKFEKRGVAANVPEWIPSACIQCNQCSYVCPHAAIRPFLLTDEEAVNAPIGTVCEQGKAQFKDYKFRMQVSTLDCLGCGNCVNVCPSKEKALVMKPLGTQTAEIERWNYMHETVGYKQDIVPADANVKNSQFAQPLFEFSGACAGCGETPYLKTITQLFGDRMMVANATGCSSIYGGSAPSTPYCANKNGQGPAWANSLFEDNAEYGYGMAIGVRKMRDRIQKRMTEEIMNVGPATQAAFEAWINDMEKAGESKVASAAVVEALKTESNPVAKEIMELAQYLVKKSVWIVGGDGWAYDIGYGGLDHVLASGEDVNVIVLDTEVYSNTGGQASKSTPVGAVAKFAASGMKIRKKDLGMMAMSYGYVYVAQVAMGANQSQYFKALKEAESYPGPSLIIAYSPCINHGLKAGMGKTQLEQKLAVEAGYWHTYRFNPILEKEGKNPFSLDSKDPDWAKFQGFLLSEVRYSSLQQAFPEQAEVLFNVAEEDAKWRYNSYKRMAAMNYAEATTA
jgi:pyruvate-ferredoxin/flavodoxin oxidoreductase